MKKLKLITGLTALATLGTSIGVLASCSCTKDSGREVEVSDDTSSEASVETTTTSEGIEITVKSKSESKTVDSIAEITIGNTKLGPDDYKFDKATGKITIKKEVLDKNPGKIIVKPAMEDKKVTGIKLSVTTKSDLKVDESFKIKADLLYGINKGEKITWTLEPGTPAGKVKISKTESTSGEEITVTGMGAGYVALVATCNGKSEKCAITVVEKPATGITIKNKPETVKVKGNFNTSAELTYKNADSINWSQTSEDDGKVSFSKDTSTSGEEITITGVNKGKVKIIAQYSTFSDAFIIDVTADPTPTVTEVIMSGAHNVDVDDDKTWSFTAKDQDGNDITSACTFETNDKDVAAFDGNKLKLGTATKTGGSLTVTAKHTATGFTDTREIEFGSFSKLKTTEEGGYSLKDGIASAKKDGTAIGSIIIPSRYYIDATNGWQATLAIPASGFSVAEITGIHISSSINSIGGQAFGSGLKTITIDDNNTTYKTVTGSNCILNSDSTELLFGCSGTDFTKLPTTVTTIAIEAFYNAQIKSITIPGTIEIIKERAFNNCKLSSLSFKDTSKKWIQTNDSDKKQLNTTNSATNAKNLMNCTESGANWGKTGINFEDKAVKSASVTWDSTSFSSTWFTFTTKTESIINDGSATKISFTGTSTKKVVMNLVVTNSNKVEVATKEITLESGTTGAEIDITSTEWAKINPQDTLTVSLAAQYITFETVDFPDDLSMDTSKKVTANSPTIKQTIQNHSYEYEYSGTLTYTYQPTAGAAIKLSESFFISAWDQIDLELLDYSDMFEKMFDEGKAKGVVKITFVEFPYLISKSGEAPEGLYLIVDSRKLYDEQTYKAELFNETGETMSFKKKSLIIQIVGQSHTEEILIENALEIPSGDHVNISYEIPNFSQFTAGEEVTINVIPSSVKYKTLNFDETVYKEEGKFSFTCDSSYEVDSLTKAITLTVTSETDEWFKGKIQLKDKNENVLAQTIFINPGIYETIDVTLAIDETTWAALPESVDCTFELSLVPAETKTLTFDKTTWESSYDPEFWFQCQSSYEIAESSKEITLTVHRTGIETWSKGKIQLKSAAGSLLGEVEFDKPGGMSSEFDVTITIDDTTWESLSTTTACTFVLSFS